MNSEYWVNKIMDTMYTSADMEFWVGLSSTLPSRDGTGVSEPSASLNYSRKQIQEFSQPVAGTVKNVYTIDFNRSTGTWFDSDHKAKYWVLFDGNNSDSKVLSSGELDEPKTVESNTTITIAAETLSITLADYQESVG